MKLKLFFDKMQQPAGVWTWRYLFSNQSNVIIQHRNAFFYVPKGKSKIVHWGIALAQQLCWYFFFSWKALINIWYYHFNDWKILARPKSNLEQFHDLFLLSFRFSIYPGYYYLYQLYHYPSKEWLHFIYDHEVPKWQSSLSSEISNESIQFLNSKKYFAEKGQVNDLFIVPTIKYYRKGSELKHDDLFMNRSLFFKPNQANRSKGCFSIEYYKENNQYLLRDEETNEIWGDKVLCLKLVNTKLKNYDYLTQDLLTNNVEFFKLEVVKKLVVLRIISFFTDKKVSIISCIMIIPINNSLKYACFSVNSQNGKVNNKLMHRTFYEKNNFNIRELEDYLVNQFLPEWTILKKQIIKAHSICKDLISVGWDVSFTDKGYKIIEGNSGWSVRNHFSSHKIFFDLVSSKKLSE